MKQTIKTGIRNRTLMVIAMIAATFSSCSEKDNNFVFTTPQEALTACHQELSKVKQLKEAKIDKLIELTASWLELKDSTISIMMRDSTRQTNQEILADFFAVQDTFKTEITRLALSTKRSLTDIVKIKVMTAKDRKHIQNSSDYKTACNFFEKTEKEPLFSDPETTITEYEKLLDVEPSLKEEQLYDFLKEEDRCFRSLLMHLKDTPQKKLQSLTDKTATLFDALYRNTVACADDKTNERMVLYLTMRFNRRIIQNAEVCRADIMAGVLLDEQQAANYRWMLMQPFMTIDNYAMALLTENQIKTLTDTAKDLPRLFAYIDDKDYDKSPKEETEKLERVLNDYLLKTYLNSVL